jgi:patatin-like phospholipase/acyl hydrolase
MNKLEQSKPFRVLSLDGGGMRGLYTATVLDTLAKHFASRRGVGALDIGKGFDLIVGTSTGGILATALAHGQPLKKLLDLYRVEGPAIFSDPMPDTAQRLKMLFWLWRNRSKAANANSHLRSVLERFFKDETLGQLFQRRGIGICIPSVRAEQQTTKVFKTPHAERLTFDAGYRLVDVCMATSAAPIFLPLVDVPDPNADGQNFVYADGGLWANNPVLVGILEALELTAATRQAIQVLSVSTCAAPEGELITPGAESFGFFQWRAGTKIVSLSLNAQAAGHQYMAKLFQDRLRELGRYITVTRLQSSPLSNDQMRWMRLDAASAEALRALSQLGSYDGQAAIHLCDGGSSCTCVDGQVIADVFNAMPAIQHNED